MARVDLLKDLGSIFSATGTALTTSYVGGADQATGQARIVSLFVAAQGKAGTSVTSVEVKLQVKDIAGNYYDAITVQNDATGTTVVAQTMAVTASQTNYYLLQSENMAPSVAGWRVVAKSTGAAAAGDSLVIRAVVM